MSMDICRIKRTRIVSQETVAGLPVQVLLCGNWLVTDTGGKLLKTFKTRSEAVVFQSMLSSEQWLKLNPPPPDAGGR